MCAIRYAVKVIAVDRVAVLAALNLAFSLAEGPASAAPATAPQGQRGQAELDDLVARIDEALGQDGQLL